VQLVMLPSGIKLTMSTAAAVACQQLTAHGQQLALLRQQQWEEQQVSFTCPLPADQPASPYSASHNVSPCCSGHGPGSVQRQCARQARSQVPPRTHPHA
jgi:hypothetical protein